MSNAKPAGDPNWSEVFVALLVTLYVVFVLASMLRITLHPLLGTVLALLVVLAVYSYRVYAAY